MIPNISLPVVRKEKLWDGGGKERKKKKKNNVSWGTPKTTPPKKTPLPPNHLKQPIVFPKKTLCNP